METSPSPTRDQLLAQNRQLQAIVEQQAETIALFLKQIEELKAEITRLKGGGKTKTPPPDWVKANTKTPEPPPEKTPRKKREHSFVRRRETPTQQIVHACEQCPDCGRTLSGGTLRSTRQVIELPEIAVQIIEHLFMERRCGVCKKRHTPKPDLSAQTVGQSRFGPRVHSLVAYLRFVGRLPVSAIASLLSAFCRLKVSKGEVIALLATVAQCGKSSYEALQTRLHESSYTANGDKLCIFEM